jgi:squalene cyclase
MDNHARQIYKPEFRLGLGGVSLGNEFNKHTDKDAEATRLRRITSMRRFIRCPIPQTTSCSTIRRTAFAA